MHSKSATKDFAVLVIFVILLCCSSIMLVASTPCCEGTQWLLESEDVRIAYVDSYINGFRQGFGQGCLTGTAGVKASAPGVSADPFHLCLSNEVVFSRTTKDYVRSITEFYEKYKDDHGMRITDLLMKLAKGQSLARIHEDYRVSQGKQ